MEKLYIFNTRLMNEVLKEGFGKDLIKVAPNRMDRTKLVFIFRKSDALEIKITEYSMNYNANKVVDKSEN